MTDSTTDNNKTNQKKHRGWIVGKSSRMINAPFEWVERCEDAGVPVGFTWFYKSDAEAAAKALSEWNPVGYKVESYRV